VKTLVENAGGSADHLVESYPLGAAELGREVDGRWTVNVADTEAQDRGRVNAVTLAFQL
jgi:subtilisin-like proprotein convertase family protein